MPKIEDIRPLKKKIKKVIKEPENIEPTFSADDFFAEVSSLPVPEPNFASPVYTRPKKSFSRMIGKIIISLVVVAAISITCFIFIVEAKNKIAKELMSLSSGFSSFSENISSKNIAALSAQIDQMNRSTERAVILLQSTGQDIYCLHYLYPEKQSSKATEMIDAVRSAHLLTSSYKIIAQKNGSAVNSNGSDYLSKINACLGGLNSYVADLPQKLKTAKVLSAEAKSITQNINVSDFSGSEAGMFNSLSKLSGLSNDFFNYLDNTSEDLSQTLTFSGGEKSYLILFLNNAELRPGGGFIGSFARLDLKDGEAKKIDFETNIYTLDQAYAATGAKHDPPEELKTFVPNLFMRDSNYSHDFADSSKSVIDFYKKESGRDVDGLISIDTTFFKELLKLTGPIAMPEYNMTINPENFMTDVQYQVEIGYFKDKSNWSENQPKKILSDMLPKVIAKLTSKEAPSDKLGQKISQAISEKHLLMYHKNENIEDLLDGVNLSGKIHQSAGDYLFVGDSNIGGLKSSLNISKTIDQTVAIDSSGRSAETLSVNRKHNGSYEWPDGENKNYVKVFLPLATNILTKNLKTGAENGKTTVSFWQNTKPGEETKNKISYRRDSAVQLGQNNFDWQILIQKQPGELPFTWNLELTYPEGWKPQNVEGYDSEGHKIVLSEKIYSDSLFKLRFVRD